MPVHMLRVFGIVHLYHMAVRALYCRACGMAGARAACLAWRARQRAAAGWQPLPALSLAWGMAQVRQALAARRRRPCLLPHAAALQTAVNHFRTSSNHVQN
jgi:hypothetical protein